MKKKTQMIFGTVAAALLTVSLGCEPAKPPAPEAPAADAAGDNTTGNTTAGAETPAGETP